jgi:hypothetical protein
MMRRMGLSRAAGLSICPASPQAEPETFCANEVVSANPSTAKYFIKAVMIESPIGGLAVAMPEAGK